MKKFAVLLTAALFIVSNTSKAWALWPSTDQTSVDAVTNFGNYSNFISDINTSSDDFLVESSESSSPSFGTSIADINTSSNDFLVESSPSFGTSIADINTSSNDFLVEPSPVFGTSIADINTSSNDFLVESSSPSFGTSIADINTSSNDFLVESSEDSSSSSENNIQTSPTDKNPQNTTSAQPNSTIANPDAKKVLMIHVKWADKEGLEELSEISLDQIYDLVYGESNSLNSHYMQLLEKNNSVLETMNISNNMIFKNGVLEVTLNRKHPNFANNSNFWKFVLAQAIEQAISEYDLDFGTLDLNELNIGFILQSYEFSPNKSYDVLPNKSSDNVTPTLKSFASNNLVVNNFTLNNFFVVSSESFQDRSNFVLNNVSGYMFGLESSDTEIFEQNSLQKAQVDLNVVYNKSSGKDLDIDLTDVASIASIKNGDKLLKEKDDYSFDPSNPKKLTILKSYLSTITEESFSLDVSIDASNSFKINVSIIQNATIDSNLVFFNTNNPKDIDLTLDLKGNKLVSIKDKSTTLSENTDYTYSNNTIRISKAYFKEASAGDVLELTLEIENNSNPINSIVVTINIVENTLDPITPTEFIFNADSPADLHVGLDMKDDTISDIIQRNTAPAEDYTLTDTDYTLNNNVVTIKKEYLSEFKVGQTINLDFILKPGTRVYKAKIKIIANPTVGRPEYKHNKDITSNLEVELIANSNTLKSVSYSLNGTDPQNINKKDYDFVDTSNTITFSKDFLNQFSVGAVLNLTFNMSSGANLTTKIYIIENSIVSPTKLTFNKDKSDSLVFSFIPKGNTLEYIKDSKGFTLVQGIDYNYDPTNNEITIKKSYLDKFSAITIIDFTFVTNNTNVYPESKITIIENSTLSSNKIKYNKTTGSSHNMTLKLNSNTLKSIKDDKKTLIQGEHYSIKKDVIVFSKKYLNSFDARTTINLTFEMSAGDDIKTTIEIFENSIITPDTPQIFNKSTPSNITFNFAPNGNRIIRIKANNTTVKPFNYKITADNRIEFSEDFLNTFEIGQNVTFEFVTDFADSAPTGKLLIVKDAEVSPKISIYNPNNSQTQVKVDVTYNATQFVKINFGNKELEKDTDYSIIDSTIIFTKVFLDTLPSGQTSQLTLDVNTGKDPEIFIRVITDSVVNPKIFDFNKKYPKDLSLNLSLNGNIFVKVNNNSSDLVEDVDYTIDSKGNIVLSKNYLSKLPVGEVSLTFDVDYGVDPTILIRVVDYSYSSGIETKYLTITSPQFGGRVVGGSSGQYEKGSIIKISAVANIGYAFSHWTTTNGGTFVNTNSASTDFIMPNSDTTIYPNFVRVNTSSSSSSSSSSGSSSGGSSTASVVASSSSSSSTTENSIIDTNGSISTSLDFDKSNNRYFIDLDVKNSKSYVSMSLSTLKNYISQNNTSNFQIKSDLGIVSLPTDITKFSNVSSALNGLKEEDLTVSYSIISKNSMNYALQNSTILEFVIDFTQKSTGNNILRLSNFGNDAKFYIAVDANTQANSVFRIDNNTKNISFVPHKLVEIDNKKYYEIISNNSNTFAIAENKVTFGDVDSTSWYFNNINLAASKKLLLGVSEGTFEPERAITRAEFVQLMINSLQYNNLSSSNISYEDVSQKDWFYDSISKANAIKLLEKFNNSDFSPNNNITRQEIAAILSSVIKYVNTNVSPSNTNISNIFSDSNEIEEKFIDDIKLVYDYEIMIGIDEGKFDPEADTSRAQAATVQINLLKALKLIN